MPTFKEYQEQIAKLQTLAEEARQGEIAEARRRVRELMSEHNLSIADFSASGKVQKSAAPKKIVAPKYRDPKSGATWTGRGREPLWLKGKSKEKFLIA